MRTSSIRAWARSSAIVLALAMSAATVTTVASSTTASGETTGAVTQTERRGGPAPLFGGTVFREDGETYREGFERVMDKYDGLDAIRMFFPGLPSPWKKIRSDVGKTPLVVSFKADTSAILSGRHDAELRKWFANAPTERRTFWTYWHEPENDVVNKADYRRAWAHIKQLANKADNRKLRSTLILMCWTLDKNSGRDWKDYYPGNKVINVLGFDCYNSGRKNGVYKDPSKILAPVVRAANSVDKPFGIAEFGTTVVESDGGKEGRARWLRQFSSVVKQNDGKFATYFDSFVGYDYRLHDAISANKWRDIVNAS